MEFPWIALANIGLPSARQDYCFRVNSVNAVNKGNNMTTGTVCVA